ncbi:glycosyltransferase family 4 protein [Bacillus testis]|uniref:glycosyltransferase family 4 protein n=1 Tax=Bacillus testis TaxID=1622072 RepID=UPI00084102FE|nr:glycosyltransferase family 4 protein [Bacillus testis]
MKIVQLITRMDEAGGAQMHVEEVSKYLNRTGHSVTIMSGSIAPYNPSLTDYADSYIAIRSLERSINPLQDFKAFLIIRKKLKEIRPDVLATHSSKAGIVGRLAGWSLGIPTVFTAHGWAFTGGVSKRKQLLYRSIEKLAGYLTTRVITVSYYDYDLADNKRIVPRRKMAVIQNGVSDTSEDSMANPFLEPINIIMVARFAEPKDQLVLLKALHLLNNDKWRLRFVGEGPLLQEAEELVRLLGMEDQVEFLGSRRDIPELLKQSQLFILTSNWEGLPLCILEAMRSGLPIIATDVGGIKEVVIPGKNGYLVPRKNEAALAEKCKILLHNPFLRKQMGERSRRLYEQHFKAERMLQETEAVYERAANK